MSSSNFFASGVNCNTAYKVAEFIAQHRIGWLRYQIRRRTPELQHADREDIENIVFERILRYWSKDILDLKSWLTSVVHNAVRYWLAQNMPMTDKRKCKHKYGAADASSDAAKND